MVSKPAFWSDLNPSFPAKGTKKYGVFYRAINGTLYTLNQYETKGTADNAAKRINSVVARIQEREADHGH